MQQILKSDIPDRSRQRISLLVVDGVELWLLLVGAMLLAVQFRLQVPLGQPLMVEYVPLPLPIWGLLALSVVVGVGASSAAWVSRSAAAVILGDQFKLKTFQLAGIGHRNPAALRDIDAKAGIAARHRRAHANFDRLSRRDFRAAKGIAGTFSRRSARTGLVRSRVWRAACDDHHQDQSNKNKETLIHSLLHWFFRKIRFVKLPVKMNKRRLNHLLFV